MALSTPHLSKSFSKNPPLSAELQQYKLLKSQGALTTLPTEPSYDASSTIFSLKSQEDERRPFKKNTDLHIHAKHLDKIVQSSGSKTTTSSSSTLHGSTQSSTNSSPWIKEALAHYLSSFHRTLVSNDSSPISRGSSEKLLKTIKAKSPSISSSSSSPLYIVDNDLVLQNQSEKAQPIPGQRFKGRLPTRSMSVKGSMANIERPKSGPIYNRRSVGSVTMGSSPVRKNSRERRESKELNESKEPKVDSIKLAKEVEEWRKVGGKMAESYNDLNSRLKAFMVQKNENKLAIASLKDQVVTLKSALTKSQTENSKLLRKPSPARSTQLTSSADSSPSLKPKSAALREAIDELKSENNNVKKTLEFLKDENGVLRRAVSDMKKCQHEADYYKRLAEVKFKECSVLAEEIICLRTDLDRCNSNFLKLQKEKRLDVEDEKEPDSAQTLNSSLRKDKSKSRVKKGVSWKEELEEFQKSKNEK